MLLFYLIIIFIYSFYCNKIDLIRKTNLKDNTIRINCNYEIYCLIIKIIINIFYFFVNIKKDNSLYIFIYEFTILIICLILAIYTNQNVYYYNNIINKVNQLGWYITTLFVFCVLIINLLKIVHSSVVILLGWIIIIILDYKLNKMNEYSLIIKTNIFNFKNNKLVETYKNNLLKHLNMKNYVESKILKLGIVKNFKEFINNNPEINDNYQKLLTNIYIKKDKLDKLPVISIIYILYSYYLSKPSFNEKIIFNMRYFLVNEFNNPTYAMYLCSKTKTSGHKNLYYKYLLMEDIKDYLNYKLTNNSQKESIKHVQIGKVILYYLYIDLFRTKIYDALNSQINYFEVLKTKIITYKITQDFLNFGDEIIKLRKEIIFIWEKIIKINPFSDEYQKDYILFLESIIKDESFAKEEIKKYKYFKYNKQKEQYNIYHNMFLNDTRAILLVDGYLSLGKILYSSKNFSSLFSYYGKELLNLNIENLIPKPIEYLDKNLIENAIKYDNINNIFKKQKDSLLKNKADELFQIKLYVKPVPNLSYGLIYYNYIQKSHKNNYIILLDKEFKIYGFTQMDNFGPKLNINIFNLKNKIIGYHIGIIIPEIFMILEYKNGYFDINKNDCELKGNFYPVEQINNLKIKIDNILKKIKNIKNKNNDYQTSFIEEPQSILDEYNALIKEYKIQNNKK